MVIKFDFLWGFLKKETISDYIDLSVFSPSYDYDDDYYYKYWVDLRFSKFKLVCFWGEKTNDSVFVDFLASKGVFNCGSC